MVPSNDCSLDSEREKVKVLILPQQDKIFSKFNVLRELYPIFMYLQSIYMKQILFYPLLLYLLFTLQLFWQMQLSSYNSTGMTFSIWIWLWLLNKKIQGFLQKLPGSYCNYWIPDSSEKSNAQRMISILRFCHQIRCIMRCPCMSQIL